MTNYAKMDQDLQQTPVGMPQPTTGDVDYSKAYVDPNAPAATFNLSAQVTHFLKPVMDNLSSHYSDGSQSVAEGLAYADVIRGKRTEAEVESEVSAQRQRKEPDLTPYIPVLTPLADTLPTMVEIGRQAAIGFGAGLGAGFGVGLGKSVIVGLATAPAAEVTVPTTIAADTIAGGWLGGQAGMFHASADIAAGQMYKQLRDNGVPPEKAKLLATTGGVSMSMVQAWGVGKWAELVQQAATKTITAGATSLLAKFAKGYFKSVGIPLADLEVQDIIKELVNGAAGISVDKQGKGGTQRLIEGFIRNFQLAHELAVAAKVAGAVVGPGKPHVEAKAGTPLEASISMKHMMKGDEIPPTAYDDILATPTQRSVKNERAAKAKGQPLSLYQAAKAARATARDAEKHASTLNKKVEQLKGAISEHVEGRIEKFKDEAKADLDRAQNEISRINKAIRAQQSDSPLENKGADRIKLKRLKEELDAAKRDEVEAKVRLKTPIKYVKEQVSASGSGAYDLPSQGKAGLSDKKLEKLNEELQETKKTAKVADREANKLDREASKAEAERNTLEDKERKAEFKAQTLELKARAEANVQKIKASINIKDKVPETQDAAKGSKKLSFAGSARNLYGSFFFNWYGEWALVMRDNKNFDQVFRETLDTGRIEDKVTKGVREWNERRFELLAEATGKKIPDIVEAQRQGRRKGAVKLRATDSAGNPVIYERTAMQAVDMLGKMQNETVKDRYMKANGFDADIEEQLHQQLTDIRPDGMYTKMVPGYLKFYEEYHPDIAKEYEDKTGDPLGNEHHYAGPILTEAQQKHLAETFEAHLDERRDHNSHNASEPRYLKERLSEYAIAAVDAEHGASSYTRLGEQFKAWWRPAKEIFDPILSSPEIRNMIRHKSGQPLLDALDRKLDYMLKGSAKVDIAWARMLDKMLAYIRFNGLANNWLYAPQHIASQVAGVQYVPITKYFGGLREYYESPLKHADTIIKESEAYKARYADVANTAGGQNLPPMLKSPNIPKLALDAASAYHRFGLSALEIGSKLQYLPMVYSIRKHLIETENMDPVEATYHASMAAETMATSARSSMTSGISNMPGGKYYTMFKQQILHFDQMCIVDTDRFLANPDKDTAMRMAKTFVVTGVATAIFPIIRDGYHYYAAKDDKERDKAWFDLQMHGATSFFPMRATLGAALEGAITKYHNDTAGTQYHIFDVTSNPVLETINGSWNLVLEAMHHLDKGTWEPEDQAKMGAAFVKTPMGMGTKHPALAIQQLMKEAE